MNIKFIPRTMSWTMRRPPDPQKDITVYQVIGFKFEEEHYCKMIVEVDGNIYTLDGRINQNPIKKTWTVHGINPFGVSVLCDVVIEDEI